MSHHQLDYATLLHERGFRVTPQRQFILDAVCAAGGHVTPDDVYHRVRRQAPALNRATVYRGLDFLCEMRLLVATQIGRQMYYEIASATPHHHLVCRNCSAVEQLAHAAVKPFFDQLERERRFTVDMDHLTLFGLCRRCRSKMRAR